MIKTHEINLNATAFNKFTDNDNIILQDTEGKIEVNDYILFKQVEVIGEETTETGLYRMTQVKKIITDAGLKDGYILVVLNKF